MKGVTTVVVLGLYKAGYMPFVVSEPQTPEIRMNTRSFSLSHSLLGLHDMSLCIVIISC
jgi:hypothetical protein